MMNLIHKKCGNVAFYYDGELGVGRVIYAHRFYFYDGTQPSVDDEIPTVCPVCKESMRLGDGDFEQALRIDDNDT